MSFQSFDKLVEDRDYEKESPDASIADIRCANCGIRIEKLPFKPDPKRNNPIYCPKCYRRSLGQTNDQ